MGFSSYYAELCFLTTDAASRRLGQIADTLNGLITTLNQEMTTLQGQVQTLQSQVQSLQNTVSTCCVENTAKIKELQETVAALKQGPATSVAAPTTST
jgi:prefoldin subunit 5